MLGDRKTAAGRGRRPAKINNSQAWQIQQIQQQFTEISIRVHDLSEAFETREVQEVEASGMLLMGRYYEYNGLTVGLTVLQLRVCSG